MKQYLKLIFQLSCILVLYLIITQGVSCAASAVKELKTNLIDPDSHIYGIPFGTSEEQFRSMFGVPQGYFRYSPSSTGMLYGTMHLFYFIDKKLYGVRIGNPVLVDPYLYKKLSGGPMALSSVNWSLSNGIKIGSSLKDIMSILGRQLIVERKRIYWQTKSTIIQFDFSYHVNLGEGPEAYILNNIEIERFYNAELPASH